MTDEEINDAIAARYIAMLPEHQFSDYDDRRSYECCQCGRRVRGRDFSRESLQGPCRGTDLDFASSLDALHEAMICAPVDRKKMAVRLYLNVIPGAKQHPDHFLDWDIVSDLITATPRQLAVAYLEACE